MMESSPPDNPDSSPEVAPALQPEGPEGHFEAASKQAVPVLEPAGPVKEPRPRSPWTPLRNPLFRALWFATLASNLGTWVHEVSASWMMTSLAPKNPWMNSLVQVANTTPMFLLALPAGAIADVVDRRRYLLVTQICMMLTALAMAVLALNDHLNAYGLLAGTVILSIASALNSPAWHAVLPSVVNRHNLAPAVNLNGLAISLARALGPGLAGVLLIYLNPAWGFALNTCSFCGVLVVLFRWKPKRKPQKVRAERFFGAVRVGLQHVRHSPRMRNVLVRVALFVFGSSALWALLPLLVRTVYRLNSESYGGMVGLFGMGAAVSSTLWLPGLRRRMTVNQMIDLHWAGFALILIVISQTRWFWIPFIAMYLGGCCWIGILANLHFSVQSVAPGWVRSRAMSVYLLCYFAAASSGSATWGRVAEAYGLRTGMLWGGIMLGVSLLSSLFAPVRSGEDLNLHPSHHWPHPEVKYPIEPEQGPVLVTVEYQVEPENAQEFNLRMQSVRQQRLQAGVLRWGLFVDIEEPTLFREVYLEESWEAHLRQHDRVTAHEQEVAEFAYALHVGPEKPKVNHLLLCDDQTLVADENPPLPELED
jgi:MFS family permease